MTVNGVVALVLVTLLAVVWVRFLHGLYRRSRASQNFPVGSDLGSSSQDGG